LLAISLTPGYAKTDELFKANARPKRIRLTLNGEHEISVAVPDKKAPCEIPVIGYAKPVRSVKLVFEEVWPGERFEDLCVSSISLEAQLAKPPKITPQR
jgi:hypothetical protein